MLQTGTEIEGYRVESLIGAGGMGAVYEATQLSLDRTVALKVLAGPAAANDELRARFRREAMLQAALDHPNVVPVYEARETDDGLFIAMKLVRGSDLKALAGEGIAPERALAIVAQAASALDAAHGAGLVHRDVKPQNILVDESDRAYLADFGLTKGARDGGLTATGGYVGSLDYTPPERFRGEQFGARGDLYALAAVLVEALTGEVPFPFDTEETVMRGHLDVAPPRVSERRPELPAALDDVVARGLAKRPEDRFGSGAELVEAARRALASPAASPRRFSQTVAESTAFRPAPVVEVGASRQVPWRALAIAAAAVFLLAVLGFALGRATHSDSGAKFDGRAAVGPIALRFPQHDWRVVPAPIIPGLPLVGPLALRSRDTTHPGTFVAGLAPSAQGRGLLPESLAREVTGTAPVRPVRVGRYAALQYRRLPAPGIGSRVDLLLVPTPRGAVALACLTPRVLVGEAVPADCSSVAATLRLEGLRALPLGGGGTYLANAANVLTRLDGARLAGRRQLSGATSRAEQGRAAVTLAAAYAAAASTVASLSPSPFARPSHLALVGALRATARDYAALAAAARGGDDAAYSRAASAVDAAEKNIDVSVRRLERLRTP